MFAGRLALVASLSVAALLALSLADGTTASAMPAAGSCGTGGCNGSDTCANCPIDCGVCPPACPNTTCEAGESCTTCAADCGACPPSCGDTACNGTETCTTCAADCGVCPPTCGDATCNGAETCATCVGDCGACVGCGDAICNGAETCSSCGADCGVCPPVCGDTSCDVGETCGNCAADCGACVVCGDTDCDVSESCSTCESDCGACPASAFGECPADLPACTADENNCCFRDFVAGSIIIPMDRCHQSIPGGNKFDPPTATDSFCADAMGGGDDGMIQAYGLVYRLMQQGIPVYWMVNPTKVAPALTLSENANGQTFTDRDIDFWVVEGATAPVSGGALTAAAVGSRPVLHLADDLTAEPASYTKKQFPVRGGAFVIADEDRARFDEFITRTGEFAGFAADAMYDFSAVELYEIQAGAELVYLDYRDAGPVYPEFNGGDSAPVVVTLDYDAPRLARQNPANVSSLWLGIAKLDDPADYPGCLSGTFSPVTAVYCDMTEAEMGAGNLTAGDFDWAWVDNLNGGTCDDTLADEFSEFMTAVPGVKDGHSIMFVESSVTNAEACSGKEPLGEVGGLDTDNNGATEPLIIRYPQNVFSQFGDIPPNFASGSVTKWGYSSNGYQDLTSLRRLVSEDTGTACVRHQSTAACDAYSGTAGDMPDVAAYGRFRDVAANGMAFYMGGRNVNQNGNIAHLRMMLNSFLALPAGQVDSTPDSSVIVEVSRSAPVVAFVDGVEAQHQGTISIIDPAQAVTTFNTVADAATFRFPHFTGHMRAIDASTLTSTATDFADLTSLYDVADQIPAADVNGCGGPPYTATCRNVFTSITTGALPAMVQFTLANAAILQPYLGTSLDVPATEALMPLILTGRDDDEDGIKEAGLGGVDRSTLAVVEASPLTGNVRPTMLYFGGLDGMLHAVCAEVLGPCEAAGQELWAFIPRTQLPGLRRNTQRLDGSPKVAEVFGDPDGVGVVFSNGFHTVLTFQIGSGSSGFVDEAPAVIALDVTDPASPIILWENATPAVRGQFEIGIGLGLAMGPAKIGTATKHLTLAQSTNGGLGGTGFVVKAFETLTGAEEWSYDHAYEAPRDPANALTPSSGVPGGVAAFSLTRGSTITHALAPSLYGDLWLIDVATGVNAHGTVPLFRFTEDYHPIGAPPAVFVNREDGDLWTVAVSGGYADPVATNWAPDGVGQFVVAMSLDIEDFSGTSFDESNVITFALAANRAYAQAVVAGNEVFIVTDSTDVNSATYGLSGSSTGTLNRLSLESMSTGFSEIGAPTSLPGGSSSVDVSSGGVSYSGSGKSAQSDDFSASFTGGGALTELAFLDNVTRLLWISE